MKQSNFTKDYNVLTGEVLNDHPENKKYSEIHTGDAWHPAMNRYCQNAMDKPVALVVFLDKTHTDLHGALSLPPVIFLAGKVADMLATCRPDSQKSALLADLAKSCRHKFVPDTFLCVGVCQISPNFL